MLSSTDPRILLSRLQEAFVSATAEVYGDPAALAMSAFGLAVLLLWVLGYDGPYALAKAPVRRNQMSFAVPLIFLLFWLLLMAGSVGLVNIVFDNQVDSFAAQLMSYACNAGIELMLIGMMLAAAIRLFCRGIGGIGLRFRTLTADFKWSFVYLLAVYPLIFLGLWAVLFAGRLFAGADFLISKHESIELLTTTHSLLMRFSVAIFAVLIVPFFEELLFRGYLQTFISTRTGNPWLAVMMTSFLFAIVHANWQHQLGLFFLSCALGYAYERSGSLLRPILMHSLFNGLSVAVSLQETGIVTPVIF